MVMKVLIMIVLILAVLASIAAFINTQIILRDLSDIKDKLRIKEEKKPSFLDSDIDTD